MAESWFIQQLSHVLQHLALYINLLWLTLSLKAEVVSQRDGSTHENYEKA